MRTLTEPDSSDMPVVAMQPIETEPAVTNGSLGYELRSSLASIHGALCLLSRDAQSCSSDSQRLLRIALSNTHRLLGLAAAIEGNATPQCDVLTPADIDRLRLEAELQGAIDRAEFTLLYQPVVRTDTGRPIGFEALARWHHPARGMVGPTDFIPVAEASRAIIPLGAWAIREACTQLKTWQSTNAASPEIWVSVNLSPCQLVEPGIVELVQSVLQDTGLGAKCLRLEVTESGALDSGSEVLERLHELRRMGVRIYIDDFGTGYSSLARLHEFPIDALKIDRSFIVREQWEMVRIIGLLAGHLGVSVVAEGIESLRHLYALKALGCHMAQGYLIARPLDAIAAAAFLGAPE